MYSLGLSGIYEFSTLIIKYVLSGFMTDNVEYKDHFKEIIVHTPLDLTVSNRQIVGLERHLTRINEFKPVLTAEVVKTGALLNYSIVFKDGKTLGSVVDTAQSPYTFTETIPSPLTIEMIHALVDFIEFVFGQALDELQWTRIECTFN